MIVGGVKRIPREMEPRTVSIADTTVARVPGHCLKNKSVWFIKKAKKRDMTMIMVYLIYQRYNKTI